jgi:hypothetical protein
MILFNRYECEFPKHERSVKKEKKKPDALSIENPGQTATYHDLPPSKREIHSRNNKKWRCIA